MNTNIPTAGGIRYAFGPFRLDVSERRLSRDGEVLPLAGKAFDLLLALVETPGRLRTRAELIELLWPRTVVEEHSLTSRISALRKALGDEGEVAAYIETVRGHGYRFIAPVAVEAIPEVPVGLPRASVEPAGGGDVRRSVRRRAAGGFVLILLAAAIAGGVYFWRYQRARQELSGRRRSIAVLPFENLSADPANAYFVSGMQDTILTRLAGIGAFRVISRTSTQGYSSHPQNLRRVARELGVATVLEGSVQMTGDRVLINVQLIDARTDNHIWARTYTRTLADVFEVEGDVAAKVATALETRLLPAEAARLARPPTRDPQAYEDYLKANYYADRAIGRETATDPAAAGAEAAALYHRAIARDPHFALAYAQLALLESGLYWFALGPGPRRIAPAERAATQALKLDPDLPQAHLAMGYVDYYGHRDYPKAIAQFEQALAGLPSDTGAVAAIAFIRRRQGRWNAALDGLKRASALDPRNPHWPDDLGLTRMVLRQYAPAMQQFRLALAVEPQDYYALAHLAWAALLAGDTGLARATLARVPPDADPQGMISAARFRLAWLTRKPTQALAALAHAPTWLQTPGAAGELPASLLKGVAFAQQGDSADAHDAFAAARVQIRDALRGNPDDPALWSGLGLAEAGLGEGTVAVAAGRRATALLPVARDAMDGPAYLVALARIYARTGNNSQALDLLRRLLAMPAGLYLSASLLANDPDWDPVRATPGFRALLAGSGESPEVPGRGGRSPGIGPAARRLANAAGFPVECSVRSRQRKARGCAEW